MGERAAPIRVPYKWKRWSTTWCTHYSLLMGLMTFLPSSIHCSFVQSLSIFAYLCDLSVIVWSWMPCICNATSNIMRPIRWKIFEKFFRSIDDASNIVECPRFDSFSSPPSGSGCYFISPKLMRKWREEKKKIVDTTTGMWLVIGGVSAQTISKTERMCVRHVLFTNHKMTASDIHLRRAAALAHKTANANTRTVRSVRFWVWLSGHIWQDNELLGECQMASENTRDPCERRNGPYHHERRCIRVDTHSGLIRSSYQLRPGSERPVNKLNYIYMNMNM